MLKKTLLDLQKRFPIYHASPKYLAAHCCGSAFPENGLAFRQDFEKVGEDKAHTRLTAADNITSWMIRHAALLQTRFSVGQDGKTPFKKRHRKDYTRQFLPFGSAGDAKVRDEETERGIWFGRATESDEQIVGTAQGVHTARSVRAKNIKKSGTVASSRV